MRLRTRKRQNHSLDKKITEVNEEKASRQSSATKEAPVSIVTYIEDEMAAFKENVNSDNATITCDLRRELSVDCLLSHRLTTLQ